MMTPTQFARLVLETLGAQRRFFKAEPGSLERTLALREAKALEARLKEEAEEIVGGVQPSLFPSEEA